LRLSRPAFEYRPCLKFAAAIRDFPSSVLGPLRPPWSLQRSRRPVDGCTSAGFWHSVPRRVSARHRCTFDSGPQRGARTPVKTPFMLMISLFRSTPFRIGGGLVPKPAECASP
jgi:hypothetical protein